MVQSSNPVVQNAMVSVAKNDEYDDEILETYNEFVKKDLPTLKKIQSQLSQIVRRYAAFDYLGEVGEASRKLESGIRDVSRKDNWVE